MCEVTNLGGVVQARYDYDPFGRMTKVSGTYDAAFGFTGHYFHAPSGLSLPLYRAYDASLGRWTSEDPLGLIDGPNWYAYVRLPVSTNLDRSERCGSAVGNVPSGAAGRYCGAVFLSAISACASAVPPNPATAKAVVDQLKPGRTMRLMTLFDIVETEASANYVVSREGFWLLLACSKSEGLMLVRAESGPKWADFTVWGQPSTEIRGRDPVVSGEVRTREKVRASLAAIPTCEFVRVMIGRESIDTTLDERWIIRDVTHQPISSSSADTLDTALHALSDRYGLLVPVEASPTIRESPSE